MKKTYTLSNGKTLAVNADIFGEKTTWEFTIDEKSVDVPSFVQLLSEKDHNELHDLMKEGGQTDQTITYLRVATKAKDGYDGFLYRHSWGTGFQDVIFDSHETAKKFAILEG